MSKARLSAFFFAVLCGVWLWRSAPESQPPPQVTESAAKPLTRGKRAGGAKDWSPAAVDPPPLRITSLPPAGPPYHGLAIQLHNAQDAVMTCTRMINEIADLGADTVMLSVNGFQKHVESTRIAPDPENNPSDAEWLRIFAAARERNLRIVFMPKILLSDPRGKDWRGKIWPTSWDEWFEQYTQFVLHFARLAEQGHVEVYIVGSELVSTEKYTDQWRTLIAAVREVYSGRLSYSANWDHYRNIRFWEDLDLIGMTTYHKLSDDPGPSMETLRESWRRIQEDILEWQREVDNPILFTEAGWCSQEGCSVEAWNYYRQEEATAAGLEEQRDCYRAFVEAWSDEPAVGGILWWEWTTGPGGVTDFSYTPKNKPAESVLRDLFQSVQARRQTYKNAGISF